MTVETIKEALTALPMEERQSIAVWLSELDYDDWDRQMARDFSPGGKGMAWLERVRQENAGSEKLSFAEGLARSDARRKLKDK